MGQKTNPIGNRLGYIRGWESNWYGGKNYTDKLVEDHKIRNYIRARLSSAGISKIVIERTLKMVTVTIHTARPGIIIGKQGQEVERLKEELKKLTKKEVGVNIAEIKRPELDARLVADNIAKQLEGRVNYRRALKMAIASTMSMQAEGIKIAVAGRLGGVEIARGDSYKKGRIPMVASELRYGLCWAKFTAAAIYLPILGFKNKVRNLLRVFRLHALSGNAFK